MGSVVLRALVENDIDLLFKWVNDRELRLKSSAFKPVSWREHLDWIESTSRDQTRQLFIIEETQFGQAIGQIVLSNISPVHRNCELSIRIGSKEHRGRGLGSDALKLVLHHAQSDLGLKRVELAVFADNQVAIKSYKKTGFVHEGTKRSAAFVNGEWKDLIIMAIVFETC